MTRPTKVFQGIAEFEEQVNYTCSVSGSKNGPNHSAKYETKHFLLYASVCREPELDLGKHRIDLTRLLPLSLEELEEEKSSGKWTTSFKLSGKAKGATINISFGYTVIGNNSIAPGNHQNAIGINNWYHNNIRTGKLDVNLQCAESLPGMTRQQSLVSSGQSLESIRSVEDIKDLHETLQISHSELASSVDVLYQKFNEDKSVNSGDITPQLGLFNEDVKPIKPITFSASDAEKENAENEFSVVEKGVEVSSDELVKLEEVTIKAVDVSSNKAEICTKDSLMKELESALNTISDMERAALESDQENYTKVEADNGKNQRRKSLSSDDDSIASEFLNMLGIEHSPFRSTSESEPESPRERLLRIFEKETLACGCSLFDDLYIGNGNEADDYRMGPIRSDCGNTSDDFDLAPAIKDSEKEQEIAAKAESSKPKAGMFEGLETEALMREWGLNEKAFQSSPPSTSGGCGSPIDFPSEEPLGLPDLGEGLGPFLKTKNGGFLRSMNPLTFRNAKDGGSLIMQVSSPVLVPAEIGCEIMEILQRLTSVGIEKLSRQANKLMPLEDKTGKTMQQVAQETSAPGESDRQCLLQHNSVVAQDMAIGQNIKAKGSSSGPMSNFSSDSMGNERGSESVSSDDLASLAMDKIEALSIVVAQDMAIGQNIKAKGSSSGPMSNFSSDSMGNERSSESVSSDDLASLAMDKIEALSIEGLRIQSGMSDEEAPSNISAHSICGFSALQGKGVNISGSLGLDGTAGLQLLDVKDGIDNIDGLMGLSLTLDEWMRLDSGELDDDDCIDDRTTKILAANHAKCLDSVSGLKNGENRRGNGSSRKCGLLGNKFTVALMVQLGDPFRNYEPVGAPMLALIQVERVFLPPKLKIDCQVLEIRKNSEKDDDDEYVVGKEKEKASEEEITSEEAGISMFRITEVHVAGIRTEPNKNLWSASTEQKSGSRWLLANGMGKSSKHPFMKSKAVSKSTSH